MSKARQSVIPSCNSRYNQARSSIVGARTQFSSDAEYDVPSSWWTAKQGDVCDVVVAIGARDEC